MSKPPILLGTSSLTAAGWQGSFYPRGLRSPDYLAQRIVYAWVFTFPGAALIGALGYWIAHFGIEPLVAH